MKITNHKLEGVPFRVAGTSRTLQTPVLLVMHYTATQHSPESAFAIKNAKASAHLIIDEKGGIVQMVEFNRSAAHAGPSTFEGRSSCNFFSIGIELINPGPLVKKGEVYRDVTANKLWKGGVVEAKSFTNKHCPYQYWAEYSEAQITSAIEAAKAICKEYGIKNILGHEDISPVRKIDPGPAFPWKAFYKVPEFLNVEMPIRRDSFF